MLGLRVYGSNNNNALLTLRMWRMVKYLLAWYLTCFIQICNMTTACFMLYPYNFHMFCLQLVLLNLKITKLHIL